MAPRFTTFLAYESQAEEAAEFYTSLFPNSKISNVLRSGQTGPGAPGSVVAVFFELDGQRFGALNGLQVPFTEAMSLYVDCESQAEVDRLWDALTRDGGEEGQCGWLKDRFGVSWQIVPAAMPGLLQDPDPAKAGRVMQAMLQMRKLDLKTLQDA